MFSRLTGSRAYRRRAPRGRHQRDLAARHGALVARGAHTHPAGMFSLWPWRSRWMNCPPVNLPGAVHGDGDQGVAAGVIADRSRIGRGVRDGMIHAEIQARDVSWRATRASGSSHIAAAGFGNPLGLTSFPSLIFSGSGSGRLPGLPSRIFCSTGFGGRPFTETQIGAGRDQRSTIQ